MAAGYDEQGAGRECHVRWPRGLQHGEIDLSFEHVDELITATMALPRRLTPEAPDEDPAAVEWRELDEWCAGKCWIALASRGPRARR
jgi:hypothetical protein